MKKTLTALSLVLLATGALAQPRMQPGLWEMRTENLQGGALGGLSAEQHKQMAQAQQQMQAAMAKMTPEQRKQMEAMMGGKQGAGPGAMVAPGSQPNSIRMCFTKEMIDRSEVPSADARCKHSVLSKSGNTTRFAMECAGPPPSRGEGTVTFTSDKSYTSRMAITTERNGKPERMEFTSTATFVGADCGQVKPVPMRTQ